MSTETTKVPTRTTPERLPEESAVEESERVSPEWVRLSMAAAMELGLEPGGAQAVGDGEPGGVVGHGQVLVAQLERGGDRSGCPTDLPGPPRNTKRQPSQGHHAAGPPRSDRDAIRCSPLRRTAPPE